MVVEFCNVGGLVVSDAEAHEVMSDLLYRNEDIVVSSDSLILVLRLMIASGSLNKDDVVVMFEGDRVYFDDYGNIDGSWPDGFADTSAFLTRQLFQIQLSKRKSDTV